ncbi:MAG: hypothetical protein GFH27_549311n91 [Chloroflexi bacterium AL-W]|nr:hypothetical protein [Chloroflexi bacterium AL-N1]NOK68731.1 hypothetical protein [Chloroflexi bacterium AL-N10]NOK76217.1 hypothetical protein [Chloroflexi bacterium AL-N5]NOK84146.1 hypothetical protein [Chloroflexi bacterium AL-W]NOK91355.1 hypothetical protein [Chloroflexi bacterium AL-N15]
MTNSNIITRTCITIVIVLSILWSGGAPSVPSGLRIGNSSSQQCQVELGQSDYVAEVC